MNKKKYLLAFSIALSIVLHAYLTSKFFEMNYGGGTLKPSVCNINETLNCDAATTSPYAEFMGIPLSLWGLGLNLALFVLLLGSMITERKKPWSAGLQGLAVASALGSLVMIVITFAFMSTICPFCFVLHALAFLQLGLIFKLEESTALTRFISNLKALFTPSTTSYGALVSLLLFPVVAFVGQKNMSQKHGGPRFDAQAKAMVEDWRLRPTTTLLEGKVPLLHKNTGSSEFEIVEFADFLCGHCKAASSVFKAFLRSYKANYKFFAFPLDRTCNSPESTQTGPSCMLAKSVYCAQQQEKGWEAHDWIFERQSQLMISPEALKNKFSTMLSDIALNDEEAFKNCLEAEETHQAIVSQSQLAQDLNLTGTPAVFVNGRQLPGGQQLEVLKRAYNSISVDK